MSYDRLPKKFCLCGNRKKITQEIDKVNLSHKAMGEIILCGNAEAVYTANDCVQGKSDPEARVNNNIVHSSCSEGTGRGWVDEHQP